MNITRIFIGLIIALTIPLTVTASPYTNTVDLLKKEFLVGDAELIVKKFVKQIYSDATDANITGILRNEIATVCNKQHTDCAEFRARITEVVAREALVRTVGRNLQALTTGYELPIDGMHGRGMDFSARYQGIISIWQTGTGGKVEDVGTGLLIRSKQIDEKMMGPLVDTLRAKLMAVPQEERAAAVWRYQHGLRFVSSNRFGVPTLIPFHIEADAGDPDNGLNTERQNLFRRWDGSNNTSNIEEALDDIWDALPKDPLDLNEFDPPLDPREIVLFIFKDDFLKRHMPENVIIWARVDGKGSDGPWGDVGIHWKFPQEPALPSIIGVNGNIVLGGRYPPDPSSGDDPVDGLGLCSHPFPAQGYLCQDRVKTVGEKCDESGQSSTQTNQITLMRCQKNVNETVKITDLGPDICTDIPWRMPNIYANSSASSASSRPVCDPETQVFYRNTIGNNACYIGTCIEESLEWHRFISGRNAFTVQGEAYPWEALMEPEPVRTPILQIPPIVQTTIPRYRPQLLLQTLDIALCQTNGLPPRTPPALCLFDVRRALGYPGTDYQPLLQRLLMQGKEQHESTKGMERTGAAIGTRISTDLYTNYIHAATRSLVDIINIANTLLSSIKEIEFPQTMCPFGIE